MRSLPGQDRGERSGVEAVIVYRAVPFLLIAAPPAVLLLTILLGSCTITRTPDETRSRARFYSDPDGRAGEELVKELDRRAVREQLQRVSEEVPR